MHLTLKIKLRVMAGVAIAAVVLLTLMGYLLGKKAGIGSHTYEEIHLTSVFVADIAPPYLFMVEAANKSEQLSSVEPEKRVPLIKEIEAHFEAFNDTAAKWSVSTEIPSDIVNDVKRKLIPQGQAYQAIMKAKILEPAARGDMDTVMAGYREVETVFYEHFEIANDLTSRASALNAKAQEEGANTVSLYTNLLLAVAIISCAVVVFISLYFTQLILNGLGADPEELKRVTGAIAEGKLDVEVNAEAGTESVISSVVEMLNTLRKADHIARESFRIKTALDSSSTAFLMCDNQGNINYANDSSMKLLRDNEMEIKKALPQFSTATIMGANISIFHSKPSHQKNILDGLTGTHTAKINVGTRIFKLMMTPFIDHTNTRLGTVVEWQDLTEEVAADQQKTRILESLDCTSTNVMIADNARNIIYMNRSVEKMLRVAENDLRQVLPAFSVDKVVGSNMDIFHKNPAHQMKLLETLTSAYTGNITVGKRSFRLIANPIFSKDGVRIGSVVEWLDRTAEVAAEKEVNQLVEKAVQGDFTARITTEDKTGFFLKLAQDLNALVTTADKGLNDVARVLGAIAKGNLTEKIDAEYHGTFGELKNYCNQTTDNLTEMLGDIRTAAETIYTASSEIASGNADLSSRTEQQAANLEETASSMEELTSTVKLNADNAKQANVLAEQASNVASNGGSLIQQVVATMSEINQSSQKIADIIGVIDGIAFQTNILALNAAVEAARAGDQGRGFAVVASEVRTLAQRSANAAKDIKGLISDSVHKIESGNALVSKSGDTMKEIVTAIKRVNDIMAEIAAASVEQSTGIEEVSTAVSQMDEMTQQNAALVEQAAAAAESLQSQADQLNHSVSQFVLSNEIEKRSSKAPRLSRPKPQAMKMPSKKLAPPSSKAEDEWESF